MRRARILLPLFLLLACLASTPPAWGQMGSGNPGAGAGAGGSDPERERIVRELIRYRERHPEDPIFYRDTVTTKRAEGTGASIRGAGDSVAGSFKATAPDVGLGQDGPSASGGDTSSTWKITGGLASDWKLWLGVAFLGAGAYFDFFYRNKATGQKGDHQHAMVCWAVGLCLVLAAVVPAWVWVLLGVAGVALVIGYFWLALSTPAALGKALKGLELGRGLVEAIETAPAEVAETIKAHFLKSPGVTAEDHETYRKVRDADFPEKRGL